MLFSDWTSLLRLLAVGIPAYLALLIILRISGKRTLSKFNAFDLVVTVSFGSTLASGLLSRETALLDIIAAFALLAALQYAITRSILAWPRLEKVVKSEPRLVFHHGRFLHEAMRAERLTEREVLAAIRAQGHAATTEIAAVVLETDGSFSVIPGQGDREVTTLRTVRTPGHTT